jgi:hypothetical protein
LKLRQFDTLDSCWRGSSTADGIHTICASKFEGNAVLESAFTCGPRSHNGRQIQWFDPPPFALELILEPDELAPAGAATAAHRPCRRRCRWRFPAAARILDLAKRGAALDFVTLGFYRFWLLTDIRRHLWSNTLVDGDAAEYTGRGKELLIGFLVALAILVPIYLGYFLIGLEAEHYQAFASIPLIAFFYLFGQFAIFRARRYRMTRTVWRGVRFWMTGSGWIYALQASLWGLLMILTLG